MNAETINKLHVEVTDSRTAADVIVAQLVAHEEELAELSTRFNSAQSTWEQRVIAIGNALTDAKIQYGKGWKRDFDTLRYAFSFTTASRYIACAKHAQLCEDNLTIEDWSKASAAYDRTADPAKVAREENRKQRAASRTVKSQQLAILQKQSPVEQLDAVNAPVNETNDESENQTDLQRAFKLLDEAIRCTKRYQGLLPHWDVLVAGLRQRLRPRPRVVSLVDNGDIVEVGGSQQVA